MKVIRDACSDAMTYFHKQVNAPEPDHTDIVNEEIAIGQYSKLD